MKAKYRPVSRTPNTTSTYVEPARQATSDVFPGSSGFVQQLNAQKQHLHHVPPTMIHDESVPKVQQGAQGLQKEFQQGAGQGFQQQGFQQGFQQQGLQQNLARQEAPVIFQKEQRPAVLKEKIIPIEEENIQPVVHRQIERREIHEVVQPIHEKQYLPPVVEEKQLPAETRQFGSYQARTPTQYNSSVEYATAEHYKRVNAPIIEETVRKTIVEEIQPVVHRDTVAPHIIKETLPIYEKVYEPEVILKETRPMMEAFAPTSVDKEMIPSAPEYKSQTFNYAQAPLETKYVFEIQQKTKLIPQGQLPADRKSVV